MGTYQYECFTCDADYEIIKSMHESSRQELCPSCMKPLERIFVAPSLNTRVCQFEAHFNHGLGKEVLKKQDITNELARIKGETGREIVEVGNDNLQSIKKTRKKYTID